MLFCIGCILHFVYKLGRLAHFLKNLIDLVNDLANKKVDSVSVSAGIDTSTAVDKLMFHLVEAFAEFERDIISERTKVGLQSAKARGRKGGKPKGLSAEAQIKAARAKVLYDEHNLSIDEICKILGIKSKTTLYKYIKFETTLLEELKKAT